MQTITAIDEQNLNDVMQSGKTTVVEFWQEGCDPCERLSPVLDEVAQRYDGEIKLVKYKIGRESEIADKLLIDALPQLIAFKKGKVVGRVAGYRTLPQISIYLDAILRNESRAVRL